MEIFPNGQAKKFINPLISIKRHRFVEKWYISQKVPLISPSHSVLKWKVKPDSDDLSKRRPL